MVNEIKMNKIWNGELIFIMKMFFCNLLPKTSTSSTFYFYGGIRDLLPRMFIKTAMCLSNYLFISLCSFKYNNRCMIKFHQFITTQSMTNTSDLLNKFSNESVETILMKMTFKEKELNCNSLPMKI